MFSDFWLLIFFKSSLKNLTNNAHIFNITGTFTLGDPLALEPTKGPHTKFFEGLLFSDLYKSNNSSFLKEIMHFQMS